MNDDEPKNQSAENRGFRRTRSFNEMEQAIRQFIRERRDGKRLNRAQMGTMVGFGAVDIDLTLARVPADPTRIENFAH